jgi:hypothetical protein
MVVDLFVACWLDSLFELFTGIFSFVSFKDLHVVVAKNGDVVCITITFLPDDLTDVKRFVDFTIGFDGLQLLFVPLIRAGVACNVFNSCANCFRSRVDLSILSAMVEFGGAVDIFINS